MGKGSVSVGSGWVAGAVSVGGVVSDTAGGMEPWSWESVVSAGPARGEADTMTANTITNIRMMLMGVCCLRMDMPPETVVGRRVDTARLEGIISQRERKRKANAGENWRQELEKWAEKIAG